MPFLECLANELRNVPREGGRPVMRPFAGKSVVEYGHFGGGTSQTFGACAPGVNQIGRFLPRCTR